MANENTEPKKISRSEKTNAKNLENVHIARVTVDTIDIFNPTNPLITKTALEDFEAGFASRMQATNEAKAAENTAIEAQTAAFNLVRPKLTRIVSAVKAHGVSAETLEH